MFNKYITVWFSKIYTMKIKYLNILDSKQLFIVALLSLLFLNACTTTQKPEIGSRYTVSTDDGNYTIVKIIDVKKKEISYLKNDYQVSELQYIDSIDIDINYSDAPETLSIKEFKNLPLTYHNIKPIKK